MKKLTAVILLISCLLSGCLQKGPEPFRYTEYGLFDTVTTVVGYGESREDFENQAREICLELQRYHRLFDIYQEYEGIHNLKTVNDQAGIAPVKVEKPILDLLAACREYWSLTEGKVNPAMGSVLSLWHKERSLAAKDPDAGKLPEDGDLKEALLHTDFQKVQLDFEKETVFLEDPQMHLDVGAVAKGYAAQRVSEGAPEGMLISIGGNVCATGPKGDGSPWTVGIQNPDGEGFLKTLPLFMGSAVTSGDYQRYYVVDGKRYHHIIDPETAMPPEYWRSVTVLCPDSALADALSTALFLLPLEPGEKLLEKAGAEAMWLDRDGNIFLSPDFPQ